MCCADRDIDIRVDSISSSAAAVNVIADSDVVPSFDIDDTPVTLRTRPTRAKLVSTMLRQRSISQTVATSRVPTRNTSILSRLIAMDSRESLTKEATALSSFSQSSLGSVHSAGQLSADDLVPDEITPQLSSVNPLKLTSNRRSRASITRTDTIESSSSLPLPYNDLALKKESDDLKPVKVETTASIPLSTATSPSITSVEALSSRISPTKTVSTAGVLDSLADLGECKPSEAAMSRISPIARNNQTLLQHLKRPPSFQGVPTNTVDVKKLRISPVTDVKPPTMDGAVRSSPLAGESKSSHSLDLMSSSSLSVTLNPPSRQPLPVKTDTSNTNSSSSTVGASSQAVPTKSNVISPRFVSHRFAVVLIVIIIITII